MQAVIITQCRRQQKIASMNQGKLHEVDVRAQLRRQTSNDAFFNVKGPDHPASEFRVLTVVKFQSIQKLYCFCLRF